MKIQTKIALWFVLACVSLLLASNLIQFWKTRQMVRSVGEQNVTVLEKQEIDAAEDVNQAIQLMVNSSLQKAEMEIFNKVVKLKQTIKGFEELSLYNDKGLVTYSSEKASLKRALDPQLKAQFASKHETLTRVTDGAIEVYQPILSVKSCAECHEWKEGSVAGVTLLRVSTDALRSMKAQNEAGVQNLTHSTLNTALVITLFAALASLGAALWLTAGITRPIRRVADQLAAGAEHTLTTASQVADASQALADSAAKQAASIEETSSALEEMSSMTRSNHQSAEQANEIARQTRSAADSGANDMRAMQRAMEEIKSSSDDVNKIIKTIDEIAFQTNILALNAAVEAARAGEAGLGFAVVADEVRNLAQRSAHSAKETAAKIEAAISKIAQGVDISTRVAASLQEIVGKARRMDELATEVARASSEQTQGIGQLNTAVTQMDGVTQSNAATAEESANAANQLRNQALAMKEEMAQLTRLIYGCNGDNPTSRSVRSPKIAAPFVRRSVPLVVPPLPPASDSPATAAALSARSAVPRPEQPHDSSFKDF